MLKVIDLDATGKERDRDAYIFTLTVGGEKVGMTEDELAETIRAKFGGQKGGKKGRKAQGAVEGEHEAAANPEFEQNAEKAGAWGIKPNADGDAHSLA